MHGRGWETDGTAQGLREVNPSRAGSELGGHRVGFRSGHARPTEDWLWAEHLSSDGSVHPLEDPRT